MTEVRYAVRTADGWIRQRRHSYGAAKPPVTKTTRFAKLYAREKDALDAAAHYSGTVVPVTLTFPEETPAQ